MTGRFRNLRQRWSRRPSVIQMTAAEWDEAVDRALERLNVTYEELAEWARRGDFPSIEARKLWVAIGSTERAQDGRLAAENARLRDDLAAERNHSAKLTGDAAEAVKGALELRATIRRLEGELQTAREQAAVHGAVALTLRARLAASPEQDKRNCLVLNDRLIEAYKAVHRLEIELGRAQGRDMAPDWHPASQAIVGGLM